MEVYRRLWPYLMRHKWALLLGSACVGLHVALLMQIPLLIGKAFNFLKTAEADGYWTRPERDALLQPLDGIPLRIAALSLGAALFMFLKRWLIIGASRHVEYDFRNHCYNKILSLSASFFDRNQTGDIMARATNDLDSLRMVIGPGILYPINTAFMITIAYYQMFKLNWQLTLLTIFPAVGLSLGMVAFRERLFRASKKVQDQFGVLNTLVRENLSGLRVVRAYRREDSECARFAAQSRQYIADNLRLARLNAAFRPVLFIVILWSMAIMLGAGGWLAQRGAIDIGDLIAFFGIFQNLIWPMLSLGFIFSVILRGKAAMARISDILDFQTDVPEAAQPAVAENGVQGAIRFRNLTFTYSRVSQPVLKNIEINVPVGGMLGIIGPTGCGKSTLTNLVPRSYPVERGQLLIDGVDVNDWPLETLRRAIGIVTQETFLFSETIENNIAFGGADGADPPRVTYSARIAQFENEIEILPKKYQTRLGERGINLSGGQKQRCAIARAIYRDPKILILDDALSAVDTETESRILEGLRREMKLRTTLVISHRASTVMTADEIVYLDNGEIVERGTHDELLALNGRYAELFRLQQLEGEMDRLEEAGGAA